MKKGFFRYFLVFGLFININGCSQPTTQATSSSVGQYMYVASGACYSGNGITAFNNTAASNQVYRLNLQTGQKDIVIADYYSSMANPGDSPVSIVDNDSESILVLVENTTTVGLRRIEKVEKRALGSKITYNGNITALSAQLRSMIRLSDNFLLVSKSTAAEKVLQTANRLTVGANAWLTLSAPASSCTTSATIISALAKLSNGTLVFAHAGAANARIGTISALGYSIAGNCLSAQTAPVATAFPTAMVYDSVNSKLIVAYGGSSTAADLNSIYAYSIDESTGAISSPQKIYDSNLFGSTYNYLLFGISAMTLDPATNSLYIATAISTATTVSNYKIEKFSYNAALIGTSNSSVLTSSGTFYSNGYDTKCISSMVIAN